MRKAVVIKPTYFARAGTLVHVTPYKHDFGSITLYYWKDQGYFLREELKFVD